MSSPAAPAGGATHRLSVGYWNLHLLSELVKRDFSARFTGSALGVAWAILQPLSLVILYWFVFTQIFEGGSPRAQAMGGVPRGGEDYVLFLICGLIAWLGFSEGVVRGTTSIVENAALVRKLTFRSEILVLVPNVSAILFEMIGLLLFIIYAGFQGRPLWSLWLLPFALVLQFALQAGLSFVLATTHVFVRDVVQVLGFALSILFWLSPIIYEPPPRWAKFFAWNPLTPLLGLFRSAILGTPLPSAASIVMLLVVAAAIFVTGQLAFRRARADFADLI